MLESNERTLTTMEEELKLGGYRPKTVSSYLGVASRWLTPVFTVSVRPLQLSHRVFK